MEPTINVRVGTRRRNHSAAKAAAYASRCRKYGGSKREELLTVQTGNMPSWAGKSRGKRARAAAMDYWDGVDKYERTNAVLFRRIVISLPEVLRHERKLALVAELVRSVTSVDGGHLPFLFAIHAKVNNGANEHPNTHAHILISERVNDGIERPQEQWFRRAANQGQSDAVGGARKAQIKEQGVKWLLKLRQRYVELANRYLAEDGYALTLDWRSFKDRGIELRPTKHVGWGANRAARLATNDKIRTANALHLDWQRSERALEVAERESADSSGAFKNDSAEHAFDASEAFVDSTLVDSEQSDVDHLNRPRLRG